MDRRTVAHHSPRDRVVRVRRRPRRRRDTGTPHEPGRHRAGRRRGGQDQGRPRRRRAQEDAAPSPRHARREGREGGAARGPPVRLRPRHQEGQGGAGAQGRRDVPEGWTRTYAIVPEQAEAIRFAAEKVLAGWSLASIAAEADGRGVAAPRRQGRLRHRQGLADQPHHRGPARPLRSGRRQRQLARDPRPGDVQGGRCPARGTPDGAAGGRCSYQVGTAHRGNPGAATCSPEGWPCAVSARPR